MPSGRIGIGFRTANNKPRLPTCKTPFIAASIAALYSFMSTTTAMHTFILHPGQHASLAAFRSADSAKLRIDQADIFVDASLTESTSDGKWTASVEDMPVHRDLSATEMTGTVFLWKGELGVLLASVPVGPLVRGP
ncbi:hypothetical protein ANO11243_075730 [Dothideomycetidae sp. 11243]|nr:hypothetical protein ANO11243_075730 [fungal sp. No.11243]